VQIRGIRGEARSRELASDLLCRLNIMKAVTASRRARADAGLSCKRPKSLPPRLSDMPPRSTLVPPPSARAIACARRLVPPLGALPSLEQELDIYCLRIRATGRP
jgi:hypothetical protein